MAIKRLAIDLGTSKVTLCVYTNGRVEKHQIDSLNMDYPSFIYYNNHVCYGDEARIKGEKDPHYCFKYLKTLIGRSYNDEYVQSIKNHVSYNIVPGKNDCVMVEVRENDIIVEKDPTVLLSMLVNHVIEDFKRKTGNYNIEYVALAFPPSFNEIQKNELRRIGILTGIRHIVLYPETTAACIYYGITSMNAGETALVVDCGAGTCDATILKYDNGFEVVKHAGYNDIGGVNYTRILMNLILEQCKQNGIFVRKKRKAKVEEIAENKKILLGVKELVDIDDVDVGVDDFPSISITRAGFANLCSEYNNKICDLIKSLNCQPTYVLLSGKGMLLQSLANRVHETVGREIAVDNPIKEPVACGLALYLERMDPHSDDDNCNKFKPFGDSCVDSLVCDNAVANSDSALSLLSSEQISEDDYLSFRVSCQEEDSYGSIRDNAHANKEIIPNVIFSIDSCMNGTSISIKEKRTYDISIGIKSLTHTDRKVIISRYIDLPYEKVFEFDVSIGKQPKLRLYEGNSKWKKENTPIRDTVLKRDDKHPDDKNQKFELTVKVDKEGFITTSYRWADTKEPIQVISDTAIKTVIVFSICFYMTHPFSPQPIIEPSS